MRRARRDTVFYGSSILPQFNKVQTWNQESSNVPGSSATGDTFGYALSAWNYGRTSQADLAVGIPFKDVVSTFSGSLGQLEVDAGAAVVIYGTSTGLTSTASNLPQLWHQDVAGVGGVAQRGDRFGYTLY